MQTIHNVTSANESWKRHAIYINEEFYAEISVWIMHAWFELMLSNIIEDYVSFLSNIFNEKHNKT